MQFNNIRTIFLDYDGCLHNSMKIYAPAFRKAYSYLVANGMAEERQWEDGEISFWLGYNSQDMWKAFMPGLGEEIRKECSRITGEEMERLIDAGRPQLYEGALEVLAYLKGKGYHLVFVSNCRTYYRDAHNRLFQLDRYFEELACSEEYGFIPKHEIVCSLKGRYPMDMVMVGDRLQDIEAGKVNGFYTIGCSYGFAREGELNEADVLIGSICELKNYL